MEDLDPALSSSSKQAADERYFADEYPQVAAAVGAFGLGTVDDEAFCVVVAPLEAKSRQSLSGPGRIDCLRAFRENPAGFERTAAIALERGRSPLALLIRMVRDGDHRREPPIPGAAAVEPTSRSDSPELRVLEGGQAA